MNVDNVKSQMRKGFLEFCIMHILKKDEAYASEVISSLKEIDLIVVEGTLYPILTRLKKDGLLTYRWIESTQGPPRKYYKLTEDGMNTLDLLDKSWNELSNSIEKIRNN